MVPVIDVSAIAEVPPPLRSTLFLCTINYLHHNMHLGSRVYKNILELSSLYNSQLIISVVVYNLNNEVDNTCTKTPIRYYLSVDTLYLQRGHHNKEIAVTTFQGRST